MTRLGNQLTNAIYRHPYAFWLCLIAIALTAASIEWPDPMQRDERGRTALYRAAEIGDSETVEQLLRKTTEPDQCDDCLWTPLMRAAQNGHLEVVQALLQAGADINARDKAGYSVLMVTAMNHNPEVLALLLEHEVLLDVQDPEFGWSALIWAAKEGHSENVSLLLKAGADPTLADDAGKTALDWARQKTHDDIIAQLSPSSR